MTSSDRLAPATEGLGLEQVVVRARIPNPETGELRDMVVRISSPGGSGMLMTFRPADQTAAASSRWPNTTRKSSACASAG